MPDLRQARDRGLATVLLRALQGCRPEPLAVELLHHSRRQGRRRRRRIRRDFPVIWRHGRSVAAPGAAIRRRPSGYAGQAGEAGWTGQASLTINRRSRASGPRRAQVAQLVEHATENRSVGGSIPPLGTKITLFHAGARSCRIVLAGRSTLRALAEFLSLGVAKFTYV